MPSGEDMVNMQLFIIEERVTAHRTYSMLSAGQLLLVRRKITHLRAQSLVPIGFEAGVIRRRRFRNENVPLNGKPGVLEQMLAGIFVSKHPMVLSVKIPSPPVCPLLPGRRLVWMSPFDMTYLFRVRPIIQ